jgi:hypothetical protein
MTSIVAGRKTVKNDRDLVVFLIGARINKWWLLPLSLPILAKMRSMQKELLADPNSGLMGITSLGGGDVQYWRSVEHLMSYADDKSKVHQPATQRFFQKIFRNEAIGIWHETYVVSAGNYECIYTNMPRLGLGKTAELVDAKGTLATGRGRLGSHGATSSLPGSDLSHPTERPTEP